MTGLFLLPLLFAQAAEAPIDRLSYPGKEANSPKIVLISGDEEYRSEEAFPQLAKILSKHHGFRTVVLFSLEPKTGVINPDVNNNIPGTDELRDASLIILGLRFRNLPEEQMKEIVAYVDSGRPIIGLRTSTHAFNIPKGKPYATWSWDHGDPHKGGFGKQVLGETWVSHHGNHGSESTLALIAPDAASHPILKGIKSGDIWGPTDVYGVDLPPDAKPLLLGQVLAGMKKDSKPVEGKKNDPMMPVAWTREVKSASGKPARIFTTTMGAATDLENEALRQLLVNATFWAIGKEAEIPEKAEVAIVGEYKPTKFGFKAYIKGKKPVDYR